MHWSLTTFDATSIRLAKKAGLQVQRCWVLLKRVHRLQPSSVGPSQVQPRRWGGRRVFALVRHDYEQRTASRHQDQTFWRAGRHGGWWECMPSVNSCLRRLTLSRLQCVSMLRDDDGVQDDKKACRVARVKTPPCLTAPLLLQYTVFFPPAVWAAISLNVCIVLRSPTTGVLYVSIVTAIFETMAIVQWPSRRQQSILCLRQ